VTTIIAPPKVVMRGLDPRIHRLAKNDGLPGLAASRRPGNDDAEGSSLKVIG
jgi:hypothetical protein